MFFRQFYLGCLAHASYLIGSEGEAAVVDPQRDVDQYIAEAETNGFAIRYVIETHLHADFVSGHCELAKRTGAQILLGASAGASFEHRALHDGDTVALGDVTLRILETPGHTPESICILVSDRSEPDFAPKLLSGDTLFIGDVGRPDLAGGAGHTPQDMAAMMYETLQTKILPLDDSIEVWPAHGAGSLCGKNISKETSSTIGQQRRFNYALQPTSKESFVEMLTRDLAPAPQYFARDAQLNRSGVRELAAMERPQPLSPDRVSEMVSAGAIALDVRTPNAYGAGHVGSSINIGLGGQYASWAGTLIPPDARLIIVGDSNDEIDEAILRLARVGLENVSGFLDGGIVSWCSAGFDSASIEQIGVHELKEMIECGPVQIIDVRATGEFATGHAPGASNIPLHELQRRTGAIDRSQKVAVMCGSGYRSSIATSVLERAGFEILYNVVGGMSAGSAAGLNINRAA